MNEKNLNFLSEPFASLFQIIKEDMEINIRMIQLLKMDSFHRRLLLIKWLEQLRNQNSSNRLMSALSCLFDDAIAEKVLSLINNNKSKKSETD